MYNEKLIELIGQPGAFDFIQHLDKLQEVEIDNLEEFYLNNDIKDGESIRQSLKTNGILLDINNRLYLSQRGKVLRYLAEAINGSSIEDLINKLRSLDPNILQYEIVYEGMAAKFIDETANYPTFSRLLICSPWIHLNKKRFQKLAFAIYKAQEKNGEKKIEATIISKTLRKKDPQYENFLAMFKQFMNLGIEILTHDDLHSKLYIRDHTYDHFRSVAVFGSENLTGTKNFELGIKIKKDMVIINKLIGYYYELRGKCKPFKEV